MNQIKIPGIPTKKQKDFFKSKARFTAYGGARGGGKSWALSTRSQMYNGEADWTLIGEVKRNPRITIPIIGNGDVTSAEVAKEKFERYGVDAIMVGRATFGRPWIFREIKHLLQTGATLPPLQVSECIGLLRRQVEESVARIGEYRGILHIRRHLAATPIFKGIPNFRDTRIRMLRAETVDELFEVMREAEQMKFDWDASQG